MRARDHRARTVTADRKARLVDPGLIPVVTIIAATLRGVKHPRDCGWRERGGSTGRLPTLRRPGSTLEVVSDRNETLETVPAASSRF
jgi:hypothetical protein